ncbi:phage integrase N-terminal domain-containing protein [Stutzerimonas nitrititolerans]|uniref:phage integrase N-terminal domain-containing protein n=1 Tax=Stutzerimonas nitrititolerans TaxID=2482751 RepID=UPI0028A12B31|nr:phage integrase N-terminal domain-containing protein [Stutzerimonas nitrititolerans]
MDKLGWDFLQQQKHNKDGSFATQAARSATLSLSARQLRELGFRNLRANTIGQRHLKALVAHWQAANLSPATIKNRMSHLRWACEKAGRPGVARIKNDDLGIERRQYVARESKARELPPENLGAITCQYTRFSLRLQAEFGLRREESIKFITAQADQAGHIHLKGSWTKGGKARQVPIRTRSQERLLEELHAFTKGSSLSPSNLSYKEQLKVYEYQLARAGLSKMHGLRHRYAQRRYTELTGRHAPAVQATLKGQMIGGEAGWLGQVATPTVTPPLSDREARLLISNELGHERVAITNVYLGSNKQ